MELIFAKSKWEMWDDPLEDFLGRAKADGFDAVEIYLPALAESPSEIEQMVSDHGLKLIAQIITEGTTPEAHLESLERRFEFAAKTNPLFVNSHTGYDIFSFEENQRIIERACDLSREADLMFTNETHRGRPTFNVPATRRFLEVIPEMRLNADFSHWFCVHEGDLSNQPENVEIAIQRSYHIHARVGHAEGSQVADPLSPHHTDTTAAHIAYWKRIIDARKAEGCEYLTITPEFGPAPYMPIDPSTGEPLADTWKVNVLFKNYLKQVL